MPTGKVKWYDVDKGFGFLSRDDGGDVFVHKAALPAGVEKLRAGDRVEFGVAAGRKGDQALSLRILAEPPSVAKAVREAARRSPDELHAMVEDMIKVLDDVQRDLRRGRYPDRRIAQRVAKVVHAVASELEA
ncbi:cold-shock protein [Pseudofrankia inefficax]|uniref:Cold-shock DNA-binding domain protein n=1 Tax=Pseudofrankia inefficax (strain DSM 45817 / CECT 9037 / DDB 130130 / EuI1c) TaxID=298654 RepID=E3J3I3_PSEI1|nr:cold-shock protein [Pseudofrankia inefficax]ADP78185.1 cold-shock DNA-binding domain protein [Pseudofrankia inefficax]